MNIDSFKTVGVVGWNKSGISLAKLLLTLKKKVKVTESKPRESFHPALIDKMQAVGVEFEFGGHSEKFIKDNDLLVLSPGVDLLSPAVQIAQKLNKLYVGEIELACWLTKARFVAITGTNGKSTTTFLTYLTLKERRKRVFLGGNIGIPVSSFVLDTKKGDIIVLEVSSFQLETILEFRPHVAALLNIEPNHLDRHPTFDAYFQAKMNIFRNQKADDYVVIAKNNDFLGDITKKIKSHIIYFSDEFNNADFSCVYRIVSVFGLSKADCVKVFSEFKGLPHRLQFVRNINGVTFINDSKSTNPSSTIWAFKNFTKPTILIAGGKDKGVEYTTILPYLKKVKKINLIGTAAEKIKAQLGPHKNCQIFSTLEEAVLVSLKEAASGDIVLLSPMCASFDMFLNYMDRGRKYMAIVKKINADDFK